LLKPHFISKLFIYVKFRVPVQRNTGLNILFSNRYIFRSYNHLQAYSIHLT
jgi:hypothetical protein